MSKFKRSELKDDMTNSIVTVVFEKQNGELRNMQCTLNFDLIPENMLPSGNNKVINEKVLSVFDVEAQGWRSFRIDSVKEATLFSEGGE